jgi:hypothetical protein
MSGRGSMIPIRPDVPDAEKEIDDNHVRIETAFRNYIHRADPDDPIEHEFEVFVGHGNIIRYFFCRYVEGFALPVLIDVDGLGSSLKI